ncbi:MAG: acetate kinase, partial [Candidatus Eisenbacteria bacterium]
MNVLVLNCGSSSLKFQVIATDAAAMAAGADRVLAKGVVERIGSEALLTLTAGDASAVRSAEPLRDHRTALEAVLCWLVGGDVPGIASAADIHAIGHRVVHGGEKLTDATRLDDAAIRTIEACIDLAPRRCWRRPAG